MWILFDRLKYYGLLMRLHRPIGILLLLWPTLWALWVAAEGHPHPHVILIFILGVIVTRSAGCIINDLIDRKFDGSVNRTKQRPLVTKKVSVLEATLLFFLLCFLAFFLVLQLNLFTIFLSFIAITLIAIYPWMKRYVYLPQFILGLAYAWSIPMAFAAELNFIPWTGWWMFLITVIWIVAYDSIYALMDREDDLKVGIKSSAIWFGNRWLMIIFSLQFTMILGLLLLGIYLKFNFWFHFGLFLAAICIGYQFSLLTKQGGEHFYRAFVNNHWVGLFIFAGLYFNFL